MVAAFKLTVLSFSSIVDGSSALETFSFFFFINFFVVLYSYATYVNLTSLTTFLIYGLVKTIAPIKKIIKKDK